MLKGIRDAAEGGPAGVEAGGTERTREPRRRLPHLRLTLTDACNLKCEHCHATKDVRRAQLMPVEQALQAVRSFAEGLSRTGYDRAELSLYGGEALLNRKALAAVLDWLKGHDGAPRFSLILNTNGLLLTPELARDVAACGGRVHISLDGASEEANLSRPDRLGRSSLEGAVRALGLLAQEGVPFQINAVLSPYNVDRLEELVELAVTYGTERIFLALPDGYAGWLEADSLAPRLLEIQASALRSGVELTGPWDVGQREALPDEPWPPLNLIVLPDGTAHLPQLPAERFASVDQFFAGFFDSAGATVPRPWAEALAACDDCELRQRCRGYLKLMTTYHTGSLLEARHECSVARRVNELRAANDAYLPLWTSLDARIQELAADTYLVGNRLIPGAELEVSADVVSLLDWFARPGAVAALAAEVDSADLGAAIELLAQRGILCPPDRDTDRALLRALGATLYDTQSEGLLFAANDASLLGRAEVGRSWFEEALARLPRELRPRRTRFAVLLTRDSVALGRAIGAPQGAAWIAATVLHSVVLVDVQKLEQAAAFGGAAWLAEYRRGLLHELTHLGLRHAGARVPRWLEEGICELVCERPADPRLLRAARAHVPAFSAFVLERARSGGSDPGDGLLALSPAPIDENPAYTLARDFAEHLARESGGLGELIGRVRAAGVRAQLAPVPDLAKELARWTAELELRLLDEAEPAKSRPYRVLHGAERSLLYHRHLGGYWIYEHSAHREILELEPERNLDVDQVAEWIERVPPQSDVRQRWDSSAFRERRVRHLRLHLHTGCNLSCSYCYNRGPDSDRMPVEVAARAVKAFRDGIRPGDEQLATIRFFGGEPLMNWPVLEHVLDTASRDWPGAGPSWVLNTNGTLLRDEHVARLEREGARLNVGLSLDGVGEVHDRKRSLINGKGSYAAVRRAAERLAEAQIPLNLIIVVGAHNLERLDGVVDFALELKARYGGFIGVGLEPVVDRSGFGANHPGLGPAHRRIVARCQDNGLFVFGKLLTAFFALTDTQAADDHFCSVTGAEMSVDPRGNLVLCSAIPEAPFASLEQVERQGRVPFPERYVGRRASQIAECRECAVSGLCGGGCAAQSAMLHGDIAATPGETFCDLMRQTFEDQLRRVLAPARPGEQTAP